MNDTSPAPRVLILCADRRLSRGLALTAADMGLDPVWRDPSGLPPDGVPGLADSVGASLTWADADDSPGLADALPVGFPAVLWSRADNIGSDGMPVLLRRPLDTVLLEAASRRCLGAAPAHPAPVTVPAPMPAPAPEPAPQTVDGTSGNPALTPLEARTYAYFLAHRGELVPRETLRELLGIPADNGGNMTDVYVSRLRKKLEKPGERLIAAVRGKGYRMD